MDNGLRYFAGLVAFGFAAAWITWSFAAALICLLSAAVGYGVVFVAQRTAAKLRTRAASPGTSVPSTRGSRSQTQEVGGLPRRAEELNHDLGHVYEPTSPSSPSGTEYGWPADDDTASSSDAVP